MGTGKNSRRQQARLIVVDQRRLIGGWRGGERWPLCPLGGLERGGEPLGGGAGGGGARKGPEKAFLGERGLEKLGLCRGGRQTGRSRRWPVIVQGGRKGWESRRIRAPASARTGAEEDVPEAAGAGGKDVLAVWSTAGLEVLDRAGGQRVAAVTPAASPPPHVFTGHTPARR